MYQLNLSFIDKIGEVCKHQYLVTNDNNVYCSSQTDYYKNGVFVGSDIWYNNMHCNKGLPFNNSYDALSYIIDGYKKIYSFETTFNDTNSPFDETNVSGWDQLQFEFDIIQ